MTKRGEPMAAEEVRQDVDAIRDDLKQLRGDFKEMLRTLRREGDGRMNSVKDRLRSQAHYRAEQAREGYEKAKGYGHEQVDRLHEQVERKPLVSVLVALGIGMLAGRLLLGRGK
jgi:ElaB/YqjD/DUF883 family membrane-anchored ribosome-binding protein